MKRNFKHNNTQTNMMIGFLNDRDSNFCGILLAAKDKDEETDNMLENGHTVYVVGERIRFFMILLMILIIK